MDFSKKNPDEDLEEKKFTLESLDLTVKGHESYWVCFSFDSRDSQSLSAVAIPQKNDHYLMEPGCPSDHDKWDDRSPYRRIQGRVRFRGFRGIFTKISVKEQDEQKFSLLSGNFKLC